MGNEAREIVGELDCPYCRQRCLVKKNAKGKLYFVCTEHGINHMNTPSAQDWILSNMRARRAGEPATEPAPPVEGAAVVVPEAPALESAPALVEAEPPLPPPVIKPAPVLKRKPPKKPQPAPSAQPARTWMDDL